MLKPSKLTSTIETTRPSGDIVGNSPSRTHQGSRPAGRGRPPPTSLEQPGLASPPARLARRTPRPGTPGSRPRAPGDHGPPAGHPDHAARSRPAATPQAPVGRTPSAGSSPPGPRPSRASRPTGPAPRPAGPSPGSSRTPARGPPGSPRPPRARSGRATPRPAIPEARPATRSERRRPGPGPGTGDASASGSRAGGRRAAAETRGPNRQSTPRPTPLATNGPRLQCPDRPISRSPPRGPRS